MGRDGTEPPWYSESREARYRGKGGSGIAQKGTAMPEEAGVNGPAPHAQVRKMQTKLHRWAAADPGRRFDDLYNLV